MIYSLRLGAVLLERHKAKPSAVDRTISVGFSPQHMCGHLHTK